MESTLTRRVLTTCLNKSIPVTPFHLNITPITVQKCYPYHDEERGKQAKVSRAQDPCW